jgi:hypothetical protein
MRFKPNILLEDWCVEGERKFYRIITVHSGLEILLNYSICGAIGERGIVSQRDPLLA